MQDKFISKFKESFLKWKSGGIKELENGTEMICHVPHIGPEAWLHVLYVGLSEDEIIELQNKLAIQIPYVYKNYLKKFNGLNVFSDSISLWGFRRSFTRTGKNSIQPYDIVSLNSERPKGTPNTWLFFGGYSWDGTRLFFDLEQGEDTIKVYRCARRKCEILQEWESFEEWLLVEIKRLSQLYNENGIKIDKSLPTSPSI